MIALFAAVHAEEEAAPAEAAPVGAVLYHHYPGFYHHAPVYAPEHFREEYLSQKDHTFKAKLRWGDAYEGQGEQFYDFNPFPGKVA